MTKTATGFVHALFCVLMLVLAPPTAAQAPGLSSAPPSSTDLPKVRVQLKWYHQFQFAGFYAALEQGYFREAGLDVELLEGGPGIDPAQVVTEGQAEFGIGNSSLLVDFNAGRPVVAVAAIFQHSPFVILTLPRADIRSVQDLEGKKLMEETHSLELVAYLKKAGVRLDRIHRVPHSGTVLSLMSRGSDRVDATTAYITTEPFEAAQHRLAYRLFSPRDLGIDFYGDTLFTSQAFAKARPQVVTALRDALMRGWRHAHRHQAATIDLILAHYPTRLDRIALTLEAQALEPLLQADVVDFGYMSRSRWEAIGQTFADAGLLPRDFVLDGFLFTSQTELPPWVHRLVVWGSLVAVAGSLLLAYIVSLNRRLQHSLRQLRTQSAELEGANVELARLSSTDALTGVHNRRHFDDTLASELARACRIGAPFALLVIDVDEFKRYNDALGHPAGDACLKAVAAILRRNAQRAGEFVARIGGEEFAVVACALPPEQAVQLGERLRADVAQAALAHPGVPDGVLTISVGLATVSHAAPNLKPSDLMAQADRALYQAKHEGRNRVVHLPVQAD